MKVAIVIPALDEAATIRAIAARAAKLVDRVIVVDDGSSDCTSNMLAGLRVDLVRHERTMGKAASLWDGFQHALASGADVVVTMDGDGQHSVEDVPRLIGALVSHPDCVAVGARVRRVGPMPMRRRVANRFADFWVSWAAGQRILDSQSGQRAYPAEFLRAIDLPHGPDAAFALDGELLVEAAKRGYLPVAVPIDAVYGPNARPSHYRGWRDSVRIASMLWRRIVGDRWNLPGLVHSLRHPATIYDPTIALDASDEDYEDRTSHAPGAD